MGDDNFVGYKDMTIYPEVSDVIPSFPPAYIVGQQTSDNPKVLLSEDTEFALVTLEEIAVEYMYSNPDGLYNLCVPEKLYRNSINYSNQSYQTYKLA